MTEKDEKIKVLSVEKLLKEELSIPYYQRPYRWHAEKHVKQLLQDLFREKAIADNSYRLGTVLLHHYKKVNKDEGKESDILDVVDGQQRLVTLSLILFALDTSEEPKLLLLKQEFKHIDSKNNLKYNYQFILAYLFNKSREQKDQLKAFILENCNLLVITVTELGEAFQLFDSQNSRGKELDPADLLKAFHLREMDQVYEAEKRRLVNQWETAIEKNQLNDVLGNYLFRLRSWKDNMKKYYFTKDDTDVFKGVNPYRMLSEGKNYPYVNQLIAQTSSNLYHYNQHIINGKWFFQYVAHYLDKIAHIEDICNQENDLEFNYDGAYRIGDKRLLKLYKNLLFCYLDKFGEDENFKSYKKLTYRWVFATRIEKKQIRYETIVNKIASRNTPINWLANSMTPEIDSMLMKVKTIKRFQQKKEEDDKAKNRKRREFKVDGLFDQLLKLEEKTNNNE
jgi:hypothetical protein